MNPDDVVTLVQSLQDNAQRLGLTWEIRLATVVDDNPIALTFDGDTDPVQNAEITNVSGLPIGIGQRVWVIVLPPAGLYVISRAGDLQLGFRGRVTNNPTIANNTLTTLTWNTQDEQSGGTYFLSGNQTIRIPYTGLWAITAQSVLAGGGGTRNFIQIGVTTSLLGGPTLYRGFYGAAEQVATCGITIPLIAGDTLQISEFQNSGSGFGLTAWVSGYAIGGFTP